MASPEEKAARTAAVMATLSAVAAGANLFKKAPAAQAGGEFPPKVLQILQALAAGMETTIAELQDIIAAIGNIPGGGTFRGWPENAESAVAVEITCQVANTQSYQAPDFIVPDGFTAVIKAHPLNAIGSLVYWSHQPAPNTAMAYPLMPNEPFNLGVKRTGGDLRLLQHSRLPGRARPRAEARRRLEMANGGSVTPIRYDLAQPAVVTQVVSTTQFVAAGLAGFPNNQFFGYSVWVLAKVNGTATPPKAEAPKMVSAFIGVGGAGVAGTVTHVAFTASLAVGDMVLLLNPAIAAAFDPSTAGFNQGPTYYGVVTAVPGANQFTIPTLAGLGAGKFAGATNPYQAFVFRDAGGASAAPQGEIQPVTGYVPATGVFTAGAYTAAVGVGDEILLVHPAIAAAFTAATQATAAVAAAAALNTRVGRSLFQMDFWSAYQALVSLTDTAAPGTDVALPNVVVAGLPAGATIVRATAFFKSRMIENTNAAANKLQGGQNISVQKGGAGGYSTGIALVDDLFGIAASTREPGDVLMGNTDLAALVTGNDTYNFQWTASLVDQANLKFYDVQTGLRIVYSV